MAEIKSRIEQWSTVITTLIAVAGVFIGIIQFNTQQRANDSKTFKEKIWLLKQSAFTDFAHLTSQIIVYRDDSLRLDSLKIKYHTAYYSDMALYIDDSTERKLTEFNFALENYQRYKREEHQFQLDSNNKHRLRLDSGGEYQLRLIEKQISLIKAFGTSMKTILNDK